MPADGRSKHEWISNKSFTLNKNKVIIQDIVTALKDAVSPVVKVLQKSDHVKVIVLGFKKAMVLREHQTNITTKLVIIQGSVNYKSADGYVTLKKFDDMNIPVNVPHSVEALEESICLLIQG